MNNQTQLKSTTDAVFSGITRRKKYLQLLIHMMHLSAFTFGGGYVIISLMQTRFVEELHWLEEEEMLNLAAIAQSSPGAVAVNAAILVGYRLSGLPGAIVCIIGTILPSIAIIFIIALFYDAFRTNPVVSALLLGMQAGVAAVIFDVVLNLGSSIVKKREYLSILVMIGAFIATCYFQVSVLIIIFTCAIVGIFTAWIGVRKELKR